MLTQTVARDKLGQEIRVGDFVIYRLAGKSTIGLLCGKVTRLDVKKDYNGQIVFDHNGNVFPIVFVRGVRNWLGSMDLARRDSRLTVLKNMVVYPNMPQEVRDVFQQAGI